MPLLLIPLALLAIVLAWLLLTPLALWQRYRRGHARRRAVPWAIAVNAWLLLASVLLFVLTAWLSGFWIVGAVRHAGLGLAAGIALGIVGLWLTRFERDREDVGRHIPVIDAPQLPGPRETRLHFISY
jgi:hypothetical protein